MNKNVAVEKRSILAIIIALGMIFSAFSLLAPGVLALSHNFDQRIYDSPTGERTYYNALDGKDGTVIFRTGNTTSSIFIGDGSGSWSTMYVDAPGYYLSRVQDDYGSLWPSWINDDWVTAIQQNATNGYMGYTCINVLGIGPDPDIQHGEAAMIPIPSSSVSNDEVTLTWQDFDDPLAPIPSDNPQQYDQVVGYMLYRSTTNATWNNNPAMGPVSGSISDWVLIAGSEASPINSPYIYTPLVNNTYYYSLKPVFNGFPNNVSARWGGLGSGIVPGNDIFPPTVADTDPDDGATVILSPGIIKIYFNESMQKIGTPLSNIPGVSWVWQSSIVLQTTYTELEESTTYFMNLTDQGFQDFAGNALVGDMYFEFMTDTKPRVLATLPANGTTNVSISGTYYIFFDSEMDTSCGRSVGSLGVGGAWISPTQLRITFHDKDYDTKYYVNLTGQTDSTIFKGANGNLLAGDKIFEFTTEWPPIDVVSTLPVNGTTDVSSSPGTYYVFFSDPMSPVGTPLSNLPGVSWSWFSPTQLRGTYDGLSWLNTYYVDLLGQGFQDIDGHPLTGETYFEFTTQDETQSPSFIELTKTGGVVRLEWGDGAGPFEIFVSNQVDGSGFNFASPTDTTSNFYWEHDVLGDGNSYSYIVRGQGNTTASNIAWKLSCVINSTTSTDQNWVSLPYANPYSTLSDIGYDIGSDKISKVGYWNTINQEWRTVIWDSLFEVWDGEDDPVKPGMAIFVICKEGQDFTWDIVGSHIDNYGIEINSTATIDQNWISVPYHVTYGKLSDIGEEIGHTVISKVVAWSVLIPQVQNYRSVWYDDLFEVWDGEDDDFMPGMGIMLVCNDGQDFVWTPTVNPIGP